MEIENYVEQYLPNALNAIIQSPRLHELPHLTIYEKAIIFAYTDTQTKHHQALNEGLWLSKGVEMTDFGYFLETVLDKLEPYSDMVFRGAQESYCDIERDVTACENKTNVTEYHFLSASKLRVVAQGFGRVLFRIYAKKAKEIETISKFRREQEVIFQKNTSFKVVKVNHDGFSTIITLKEI